MLFALKGVAPGNLEVAIATLGSLRLPGDGGGTSREVSCDDSEVVVRVALGRTLMPLSRDPIAPDIVRVRRVSPGVATVRRRSRWPLRRSALVERARRRRRLHGAEVVLAWYRRAWAPARSLRARAARHALRPVVFDRAALARLRERRSDAGTGAPRCSAFA